MRKTSTCLMLRGAKGGPKGGGLNIGQQEGLNM